MLECPAGTFQSLTGQSSCQTCPATFYCNENHMTIGTICPTGSYCPAGSTLPVPCPRGTYSSGTSLSLASQCTPCPAGLYCDQEGMITFNTAKKCAAGYICNGGSYTKYPVALTCSATVLNCKCQPGYRCSEATDSVTNPPIQCAAGTFQNSYGGSVCKECPPGYYCGTAGLTAPTGPCSAGYYCTGGASTPNVVGTGVFECPIGMYCPAGSASGIECPDGTESTALGSAVCANCPAGVFCKGSDQKACTY